MLPVDATVADDHPKWGVELQQREERGQVEGGGDGAGDVARSERHDVNIFNLEFCWYWC